MSVSRLAPTLPLLALLALAVPSMAGAQAAVINEIHFAADSGLNDGDPLKYEYVELYNPGPGGIDLNGWQLRDSSNALFSFPDDNTCFTGASCVLPEDAFLVIYSNAASGFITPDTDPSDGSAALVAGAEWSSADLTNTGDAVQLYDAASPGGTIRDFVYYDQDNTGDANVDDDAVTAGIWKDGAAIDTLSSGSSVGRSIYLVADGQAPNEVNATADAEDTDWMQYSLAQGGTPGGTNALDATATPTETPLVTATPTETPGGPTSTPTSTATATGTATVTATTVTCSPSAAVAGDVVINEIVTQPRQDWSDSTGGDGIPFNDMPGSGSITGTDEWFELYNASAKTIDLTGWQFILEDSNNPDVVTLSSPGGATLVFTGGTLGCFAPGAYLVIGNPPNEMNNTGTLTLQDASMTPIDEVVLGTGAAGGTGGGVSTGVSDESLGRFPNGTNTVSDAADFRRCSATIGAENTSVACPDATPTPTATATATSTEGASPTPTETATPTATTTPTTSACSPSAAVAGDVVINEIVTQPRQDWSDSTGGDGIPFNATPGSGTVSDVDEWFELYNSSAKTIDLTGWQFILEDSNNPDVVTLSSPGGATLVFTGGTLGCFAPGAYLVIGNPPNAMNNTGTLTLQDASMTLIDEVVLGTGGAGGTGGGVSTGVSDESLGRFPNGTNTASDAADFRRCSATIGSANTGAACPEAPPTATPTATGGAEATATPTQTPTAGGPTSTPGPPGAVLINEVVTDPKQDWNDSGDPNDPNDGVPFDATPYSGPSPQLTGSDEWIELYNNSGATLDLTGWMLVMTDSTPATEVLGSGSATFVPAGSLSSFAPGSYLVIGNPVGDMLNTVTVELQDSTGVVIDRVVIGPGGAGGDAGGNADGVADESLGRFPDHVDTGNDAADFRKCSATIGSVNTDAACPAPPPTSTPTATVTATPVVPVLPAGSILVDEFQTGGSGSGTTAQEFVELRNTTGAALDLSGHELVYRSSGGTERVLHRWAAGSLVGEVLVVYNPADFVLPASLCDAQTLQLDSSLGFSSTAGGLAVRHGGSGTLVDAVEYWNGSGSVPATGFREGAGPALAPSGGESASRLPSSTDTDQNNCDFRVTETTTAGCPNTALTPTPAPTRTPTPVPSEPTLTPTPRPPATNTPTPNPNTPTPTRTPTVTPTAPSVAIQINEVAYTRPAGANFIELKLVSGPADTSLDNFWLLRVEGSGSGAGNVERALNLGGLRFFAAAAGGSDPGFLVFGEDNTTYQAAYARCAEVLSSFVNLESGPDALVLVYAPNATSSGTPLSAVGGTVFDAFAYGSSDGTAPPAGLGEGSPFNPGLQIFHHSAARRSDVDTNDNAADFVAQCIGNSTPGRTNPAASNCAATPTPAASPTPARAGLVLINEVVTDPRQDWDDSLEGDGIPFNAVPGVGTVSASADEWIELYNNSSQVVDLTNWTLQMIDTTPDLERIGQDSGVLVFSGGGSIGAFQPGEYLVIGDPEGSMSNALTLDLHDSTGTLVDRVVIGAGGAPGDGQDGNSSGLADEAVARFPNATDTGDDASDFRKQQATIGAFNGGPVNPLTALGLPGLVVLLGLGLGLARRRRLSTRKNRSASGCRPGSVRKTQSPRATGTRRRGAADTS